MGGRNTLYTFQISPAAHFYYRGKPEYYYFAAGSNQRTGADPFIENVSDRFHQKTAAIAIRNHTNEIFNNGIGEYWRRI